METKYKTSGNFIEAEKIAAENVAEGVERRILGYDSELMMTHVKFRSGAVGAIHHHPHRQVSYIKSGSFEVIIGNEKRVLKSGDCYFVPPEIEHGVIALEDSCLVDVFAPSRTDFLKEKD